MKATAIDAVMVAIVAAMKSAVTYPVFDGPPSRLPAGQSQYQFLVIGAEILDDQTEPTTAATMDQAWSGLGEASRSEELHIHCVAVGRADSIANARAKAMAVIADTGTYLPRQPTPECYGALISTVTAVRPHNMAGGALVHVEFTISATARLT